MDPGKELLRAFQKGDLLAAQSIIDEGADLFSEDALGLTFAFWAQHVCPKGKRVEVNAFIQSHDEKRALERAIALSKNPRPTKPRL